ncbi:MAG: DNA-binding protein WhiA [Chloroflexota bacterium]
MARPDAGRDRDLVEAIRSELAAIEPARACCRAAERLGLGAAATGHARTPAVARLAVRLEETPGAGAPDVPPPVARFDWAAARDHCRAAWLRGLFLSRGSLSLGVGTAHLELVVTPDDVPVLLARLEELELPASARLRRGRGVVTWKSAERILTFLRVIGASSSVLEVESRLVTRQLHGHLNRVLNAETSNLSRSVSASVRQRRAIEQLEAAGLLITLPELERSVAQVRQDQPDASLGELAELLALSRPRVQRALERIELAAAHAPSGRERPPDR